MALLYSKEMPFGSDAIDFSLPGTDGKTYSLESFNDAKALVLIFTCNHCPYAIAIWPRIIELESKMRGKGVQFVAINPNDAENYPDDHPDRMKEKVEEWGIKFPYLFDELQQTAKSYDAQCTPDIYVYDADNKLKYHGQFDDNWKEPENVTHKDLEVALEQILVGDNPPEDEQKPSMGCSIKWRE